MAFSPDGTRVVTGSCRRTARVWDAATGASSWPALDHDGEVYAVAFSPDGTRVATAQRRTASARVFDAATGEPSWPGSTTTNGVRAVAFSPDGTRVATASSDSSARVFDAATGAQLARLDHDGEVYAVAFSPDGTRVATASSDRSARVFEATPQMLVQRAFNVMTRPLNPAELRRYSLHPDCRHVKEWSHRESGKGIPRQMASG